LSCGTGEFSTTRNSSVPIVLVEPATPIPSPVQGDKLDIRRDDSIDNIDPLLGYLRVQRDQQFMLIFVSFVEGMPQVLFGVDSFLVVFNLTL
jgi:hypothetical protein